MGESISRSFEFCRFDVHAHRKLLVVADHSELIDFEASCLGNHTFPIEVGNYLPRRRGHIGGDIYPTHSRVSVSVAQLELRK